MRNQAKNKAVLGKLKSVKSEAYQHAYLIEEESNTVVSKTASASERVKAAKFQQNTGVHLYDFMYNPESLQMSLPINYIETSVPLTSVQPQNFSHGGNIVWSIPELWLDSHFENKTIQPLIDSLIDLRNPVKKDGISLRPKILYFRWGSGKFGPAVLINIDANVTNWIDGQPSRARVSLTLKEVPAKNDRPSGRGQTATGTAATGTSSVGNLKKKLSDKQIIDGTKLVQSYLKTKPLLPKSASDVLKDPKSKLIINKDTGAVSINDSKGVRILTIGVFNGDRFKPNINYTVSNPKNQVSK